MDILGTLLSTLAGFLGVALDLYTVMIFARALLSWIVPHPYGNPFYRFLARVTEPVLAPIRRILPGMAAPMDFSPIIAMLILYFVRMLAVPAIHHFAMTLR